MYIIRKSLPIYLRVYFVHFYFSILALVFLSLLGDLGSIINLIIPTCFCEPTIVADSVPSYFTLHPNSAAPAADKTFMSREEFDHLYKDLEGRITKLEKKSSITVLDIASVAILVVLAGVYALSMEYAYPGVTRPLWEPFYKAYASIYDNVVDFLFPEDLR